MGSASFESESEPDSNSIDYSMNQLPYYTSYYYSFYSYSTSSYNDSFYSGSSKSSDEYN
jgi:hypothetical protein